MLTIEGVMKRDRAHVYGGTRIAIGPETASSLNAEGPPLFLPEWWGNENTEQIRREFRIEQPDRQPLHKEVKARVRAAHALGVKALKAPPRIGAFQIYDDEGKFFLSTGTDGETDTWIERVLEVVRAIEAKGVGVAQVKELGLNLAGSQTDWHKGLQEACDTHQQRALERAFAEWADGDAIASHIAYDLDVFCSADMGKSNANKSVLDPDHRQWLERTYKVTFMSLEDLLAELP